MRSRRVLGFIGLGLCLGLVGIASALAESFRVQLDPTSRVLELVSTGDNFVTVANVAGYSHTNTGADGDKYGYAVVAGDFNCDGFKDLAVGAPGWDNPYGADAAGHVLVFRGGANFAIFWEAGQDAVIIGTSNQLGFGSGLSVQGNTLVISSTSGPTQSFTACP